VYFLLYLIQIGVFFSLPHLHTATAFTAAVATVGLCYGGGFGTMPSFTADFFGSKYMGGIYGWILLAWGAAAIPSPILIARVRQTTGTYQTAIMVIAIVMVCSLVLPLVAKRPRRGPGETVSMPKHKAAA
jgi:OFA family oxalate/formate antiporter-like MFS transporter